MGTEVSAKFKGAFCEAKIKRVEKQVKCKITYKHNNQQATVADELVRSISGQMLNSSEFKVGMVVSVLSEADLLSPPSQSSPQPQQLATLNKVIDQSAYTVIFNDGDEKVVRRSFIRFKGERHYLDSETLNNAPLNNPEHFLYPIKSGSKLSPMSSEMAKRTNSNNSVTDEDSMDNLRANESAESGSIKSRKIKENEEEAESESEADLSGNSSDEESSSSEDCPTEVKDRFVAQLYKFMDDRGTSMNRAPSISNVDLDLHRLYTVVRRYGGYNKVCRLRHWFAVYKRLGLPGINCAMNILNLKSAYKRLAL